MVDTQDGHLTPSPMAVVDLESSYPRVRGCCDTDGVCFLFAFDRGRRCRTTISIVLCLTC